MKSVRPASAEMLLRRTSYVQILLLLCAVCRLTPAFPTQTPPSYDEALRLQVSIPHSGPVLASLGSSISMPCLMSLSSIPTSTSSTPVVPRIKWTVVSGGVETQILVARGQRVKINEAYRNRAALYNYTSSLDDLSLWLGDLRHTDSGHYRCEVQRGLEDASDHIQLKVKGVVFHYRDAFGRYAFSFQQAQGACEAIGAQIATPDQLLAAYNDGYEQCDAGWLADQSVRYPIQMPREACYGDMDGQPGVRNYGTMDAENLFDVYCFIEQINGEVFHDSVPQHLSFEEAKSYCKAAGAELATTAQLYSAWSEGLDHCSPGWLSDGSVRYPIINPRERCGGPQAGVKTLYRFSNQTGFPEPSSLHDVYCFRENRRTSSDPPMDYMTTEPEESAHNVVILMENDQELQLNQQSEQVEREAQSILESLPFFSVSITPKTSDDTTSTVIADTTDSPASTTSAVDQLHPFNKTSEMSHSLHPTAVNSTITSTETYNHIQNTSFLPSVHNETDSHQNLSFTFQSGLERTTSEPHTQNQPVPDTNLLETPQPSAKPRQLHDIHETSLNFSRAQANYSETDSNHTQDAGFWEAATLSIDSMLQVKLGEAAVEDPLQKPLTTQTSKEGTTPTEVAQMVESATEALTSLWPNMDGSGDISKERDFQVDGATFLSSSPSYAASFMTHPSPSAMASSAPITYQTDAPDPTLMSGSHHLEKVDFDNATVPQFGEFSISRQEGSTSLEMEDTLNMENEEKQLYATQSVDQAVSEASFPISEFPEGLNNSYSHTEFMTAQSKTSGYRVNLDTVTSSYEEASGYEPETVSSTYRDDIQVSPAIKNETVVSPVIIQESNVSFSLGKEVKIAPTLFIEEEAKVVPTLIIEEEAKVAPTLVTEKEAKVVSTLIIEEEAKVAPTLVIEEEEEKVAPTLVIEEEAKVVPTLIIEEEEEKVAPTLVVEEEAKVAPTLVVEEEAKVAPTLVIEEEEEKVVPTLVVEEEAKVAPTLVIEEEAKVVPTLIIEEEEEKVAPTLVIEEEAKVVPTLIIEEEEEKVAPTLVVEEEAKVVPTLIIEEEEEKVAPTLVVEEEAKVVPTLVIEEEAKVAPTLVTEEEEEKVAPTLVIEEEAKVAPTLSFKETKVAPTLVVEEEAKVAPTLVIEEEEEKVAPTLVVEEEAKVVPTLVIEEEEEKVAPNLVVEEEAKVAPTLVIEEEEEKVAPTLVVEEEAKVVPTLVIEEEEEKVAPNLVVEEEAKVAPTLVFKETKVAPTLVIEEEAKVVPTLSFKETKVAPTLVVEEEAKVFEEAKFNQTFDHKEDAKASTSLVLEGEDKIPQGLDYEEEVNGAAPFEDVIISPSDSQTSKWALLTTTTRPQMALKDVEFSQKMSSTPPSHSSTKPTVAPTEETSISFTSTTHWSRRTWSPTTTTHKVFHKTAEPQKVTHVIPPVDHGLADVEISLTQPPTLLILPNERAAVGGTGKSSDACLDNPCLNGGTCTEWNGKIKCLCLPTYGEDFCQTDLERCEPGWDKFQGFCYRHSAQRQSWEVAEQHCRMMGAHLVSIMNPEEQDYINSNYKEYQWTGLNDKMIEDDFRWSDGNPLLYENWYRGQPDSYFLSGEDCVVMVWHDNGRWSDVPCNYHLAYTCKKGTSSCGPPPKVRNASIFGKPRQRYETNAVVRYHCAEGFQQRLNPLIRCQSGGRWERPQILCIPEAEASMQFPDETSQTDSNFAAAENMFEATEETPLYKDIKF
ncbi:versican core protein-like isoform X2 [Melanotaenia boesemani]|uniref:versican core protein-like isoform X2 n=1 Tax=Melanotaenia boesemani TaxID=1250792 RepID=UPI001C0485F0|nr:versican core protein-like isoform X2 [Melanotaenia boesemani]